MTHLLPPNLLRLFVARPTLDFQPALPKDEDIVSRTTRAKRIRQPLDGVSGYMERVKQEAADKGEATEGAEDDEEPTDAEYVKSEKRREDKKKRQEEYRAKADSECEYTQKPS